MEKCDDQSNNKYKEKQDERENEREDKKTRVTGWQSKTYKDVETEEASAARRGIRVEKQRRDKKREKAMDGACEKTLHKI